MTPTELSELRAAIGRLAEELEQLWALSGKDDDQFHEHRCRDIARQFSQEPKA